jgi:hypothetical protein
LSVLESLRTRGKTFIPVLFASVFAVLVARAISEQISCFGESVTKDRPWKCLTPTCSEARLLTLKSPQGTDDLVNLKPMSIRTFYLFYLSLSVLIFGTTAHLEAKPSKVHNVGGKTFATLEQTRSADQSVVVAIGFAPQKSGIPSINWENYHGDEQLEGLLDGRDWEDGSESGRSSKADYFAETVLLLDTAQKLHPLKFPAHGVLPRSNRSVEGEWSGGEAGQRAGVLIGQARNGTMAFSVIRIRGGQVLEDDLSDPLSKTMESELKKLHGKKTEIFEHMRFDLASKVSAEEFFVRCENLGRNAGSHLMFMRVSLKGGLDIQRVGQAGGFGVSEDEYKSADAELNRAYQALIPKLYPEGVADLKQSQRGWIGERDAAVKEALKSAKLRVETAEGKSLKRAVLFLYTSRRTHLLLNWGH